MPTCPNPRCRMAYPTGTVQCTNPFCQCLLPGALVAGRYSIEDLIGLGGMGAVYRVQDTLDMQQVALKVISAVSTSTDSATAIERFRREARYARQIQHKNIVPILNFGQDGSLLYIVMPLIIGGTLKSLLKSEQPLPLALTQRYVNELADAIDAIHSHPQQIVHRDIKPSNLLLHQDDGHLLVADFGIARAMQHEQALTQRGWAIGTEHYVAPEQGHGKAEPASDIYSMGVVTYQMLTGLLPFQAVVRSHGSELPPPSSLNPAVPTAVDAVIKRAMDILPENRYPTARAFADDFNLALNSPLIPEMPTIVVANLPGSSGTLLGNANVIARLVIPENPCTQCGQDNRKTSRFCRACGQNLGETSPLVTDICQIGYVSDVGRRYVAGDNEDMLLISQGLCVNLALPPQPFCMVGVADGLRGVQGTFAAGHEASRLAIEAAIDVVLPRLTDTTVMQPRISSPLRHTAPRHPLRLLPPPDSILEQWLVDGVRQANQVIYHCNADYDTTMASTITAAILYKYTLYVANVGDSRAYHYTSKKGLHRITTDHTLAANLVDADLLHPDELYSSSKRNQHYRYLGQSNYIQVDLFQHTVEADDLILLCTDGLWHMLKDEQMTEILAQGGDIQKLARSLVDAANLAGGEGNVSAVVVRVL